MSAFVFYFLSDLRLIIKKEDYVQIIDLILSSVSISLGFFGALFTFVFGLKDNKLLNKVMSNHETKSQFKLINLLVIIVGFSIIFSSLINLAIIYFDLNFLFFTQYYILCFIFSSCIAFYGFLIIFMVVITNIIFIDENKKRTKKMETKVNPPIKNFNK